MEINFKKKVVLVTGASRGIGRVTAKQFAEAGARLVVHYHQNLKAAEQTLSDLPGGPHLLVRADLSDPEQVRQLTETIIQKMNRIHILVNNAGVFEEHPLVDISFEKWQQAWWKTISTNLMGPANLSFCVVKHMMNIGGGKIVNVSSRGAFRGEPTAPAYAASKAGLNIFGQSIAKALAPHNIYVYTVAPGFVNTEMAAPFISGPEGEAIKNQSPLGRIAKPEEVAKTIVFLSSKGTEYLTGCIIDINGASYLRT